MILYFSGNAGHKHSEFEFYKVGMRNRLISYAYIEDKAIDLFWLQEQEPPPDIRLFVDSGAFTAFNQGGTVNLNEYMEFLHKWKHRMTTYANLDVIGDYQRTAENAAIMESNGLNPLIVFHVGSPMAELERLCEKYDYIGLGGLVPLARQKDALKAWIDKCFRVIRKYWPKKIHLLGITSQWCLETYPVYSCDSGSAIVGAGVGGVVYSFENGRIQSKTWKKFQGDWSYVHCFDKLAVNGSAHMARRCNNIQAMTKYQDHITSLWKHRGIEW